MDSGQSLGQKILAESLLMGSPNIVAIRPNSMGITESAETKPPDIQVMDVPVPRSSLSFIEKRLETGKIELTEADIIVSGGRGMKSGDNWQPLEELAGILGAAMACSRPVSDEGWRPHEEHTGQTGKIIAPNLYLAFGISGAIQHLAGVS